MKALRKTFRSALIAAALYCLVLCAGAVFAGQTPATGQEEVLTNASVVRLVRARFSERTIIAIIRARPCRFDLAPDRLIELKRNGVSERLILAMLARDEANVLAADDWDDDPFFSNENSSARSGRRGGSAGGGDAADIFGSRGGASGRTRERGGGGSTAGGDTETTGSATVRILRAPVEAGGAPPRLERTPTLTNDSIVELVEAGFSEGTIIRRIEQSPVEFDLSPAKIAELQRRRVGDRIIAAMRAAMADEPARANASSPAAPE